MALGLNYEPGAGGDIIPIVKYNAKAGRIIRVDRLDGGKSEDTDITREFKAVFDFDNVETGFINFETGSAPDFSMARLGEKPAVKPTDKHRPGLRIMVKLGGDCSGGRDAVREMACTAKSALNGFDKAHDAYLEGVKANPGKLPVMKLANTIAEVTPSQSGKTTNYVPVFEIVSWVNRPGDLVYTPKASTSSGSGQGSPPATGSQRAEPPAQQQNAGDGEDFG